jgi:Protein of unknown function (DUF3006)
VNTKKYTLDQIEGDKVTLLLRSDESEELIIKKERIFPAKEGDILEISFSEHGEILSSKVLVEETNEARHKARSLLEKLKNKNK